MAASTAIFLVIVLSLSGLVSSALHYFMALASKSRPQLQAEHMRLCHLHQKFGCIMFVVFLVLRAIL